MTVSKTWVFCYTCQTYHTASCSSWFSRSITNWSVSPGVQYYVPEWKIELWSTGGSRITARRERSE